MIGHIIFLSIFYLVLLALSTTLAVSLVRTLRDFRARRAEAICWKAGFADLPARDRICRHVFTGDFRNRLCDKGFDCRECQTHAGLVAKRTPEAGAERYYHRGHTWVQPEPDGTVTVGLDDLGTRMLAQPEAVDLPAAGTHLRVNAPAWHAHKRGADVRILSPVDGEVIAAGGPEQGWYLKVKPVGGQLDARHLLRGAEVQAWEARETERLHMALSPTTAMDGGVLVEDIAAACPRSDWDELCAEIFLEP